MKAERERSFRGNLGATSRFPLTGTPAGPAPDRPPADKRFAAPVAFGVAFGYPGMGQEPCRQAKLNTARFGRP